MASKANLPEYDARRGFTASNYAAVTPSDTQSTMPWYDAAALAGNAEYLYVTGAGDLSIIRPDGTAVTITWPANTWFPGRVRQVKATTTTATGIIGFW